MTQEQTTYIVTVNMYSGRPNPVWELSPADAQRLEELLEADFDQTERDPFSQPGRLGYRGIVVTAIRESYENDLLSGVFDGVFRFGRSSPRYFTDNEDKLERFLFETAPSQLSSNEREYLSQVVSANSEKRSGKKGHQPIDAPVYDPAKWNRIKCTREHNNCYNYANDKITNSWAQPGKANSIHLRSPFHCGTTTKASQRDGLISIPDPKVKITEGHIVALFVAETKYEDFHWYRLDRNGMWSHKPGMDAATNLDNVQAQIVDPMLCDRAEYNKFCGFFQCIPSQTRIE